MTFENIEGKLAIEIPYLGKLLEKFKNGIVIILAILIFLVMYLNRIEAKEKSTKRREKKKLEDEKFIGQAKGNEQKWKLN